MSVIVIALQKAAAARKIRGALISRGFENVVCVPTAAAALMETGRDTCGVVISGYKLPDMYYRQLRECLPKYFELLFIGSPGLVSSVDAGILALSTPLRASDLVNTVEMVLSQQQRRLKKDKRKPVARTWQEENLISNAKLLLMERNHLTEPEAHRYIQKCSMDNGTNMVETAQMILTLLYEEC